MVLCLPCFSLGILVPGDFVSKHGYLQGKKICLVLNHSGSGVSDYQEPSQEFQVKCHLSHGSYAVVYLVQEVLYHSQPSEDGHMSIVRMMELVNNKATRGHHPPSEDLFYFLKQARDHFDSETLNITDFLVSHMPLTPGLLSTLHLAQLLS
ncbi:hypothetical protein C0995_009229 [Termitomyces sp. Mi166|nr:hypothetical protein C0995_009229 [Termitomyces sp. Mi166\